LAANTEFAQAYFVRIEGEDGDQANGKLWITAHSEDEAHKKAEAKFPGKKFTLERDPDVLDTWFSSGLWPFSTLGWPKKTLDLENLFPTSVLETGWVSTGIMPYYEEANLIA